MKDRLRILLVDDDLVDRKAVHRALKAADIAAEVEEADSSARALALLQEREFDCVLLDYLLPDGDGLMVVSEARARGIRTPIIILTGQGDEETAVRLMKAGASDYVPKGTITPERLAQSLRTAVRLYIAELKAQRAERERALLLVLEQAARAEAEAAQLRFSFLAAASTILGSSLDSEACLSDVARLAVPQAADWCAVDLADGDDGMRRVATAWSQDGKTNLVRESDRRRSADPRALRGVARVLRAGEPEVVPEVPDAWFTQAAPTTSDAEHLRLLRDSSATSYMIVPLAARGRTLGAITLVYAKSGRRYGPSDLALAEDLARRAALAVDNALLYHDARAAGERARREAEAASTLAHHHPDALLALDRAGLVTFANAAAESLLGAPPRSLAGARAADVLHVADGGAAPQDAVLAPGAVARAEDRLLRRLDGDAVRVRWAVAALPGSDGARIVTMHEPPSRSLDVEEPERASATPRAAPGGA